MFNSQKRFLYYLHPKEPANHHVYSKKLHFQHSRSSKSANQSRSLSKSIPKLETRKINHEKEQRNDNSKRKKVRIPFQIYNHKKIVYNCAEKNEIQLNQSERINNELVSHLNQQPNIFEVVSQDISIQESLEYSVNSHLKIQPGTHFFLCKNCYEFYLTLQIREHSKICKFFNTEVEFQKKWLRLAELLYKISTQIGKYRHVQLFELSQEMKKAEKEGKIQLKKYLKEDKTKYKNNFIDENDLVWIIDEMEMNLRKKERNKKKIVWMPCKGDI